MSIINKTPSMIGGVLLVIGNVIGVGVLALPIVTAQLGLYYALLTLLFFWLLMMLGAYYFLEANLALPSGANLISMSRAALGKWGVLIAWVSNLIVMYAIISAYVSGGGDLIKVNLHYLGVSIPSWASIIVFLYIFGFIISRGIHITDHTNRLLMTIKAAIFVVVLAGLSNHASFSNISLVPQHNLSASLLIIVLTSFGFATLIPSLRSYYHSDVKKIKTMIFWGTFIPFVCYALWVTLIFAVLPYHGTNGLEQMVSSTHPVSDLQLALSQSLKIQWITQATNLFSSICIITSFLANSISFTDFIADGLGQKNKKSPLVYFIAYFPVLCVVLFYPKAFLMGLSISSTLAVVQLLILPGLIVWFLRYRNKNADVKYSVFGGKLLLVFLLVISVGLLILSTL